MNQDELLERITVNPDIFGGKPIIRGGRPAVGHVFGMPAAGDTIETILEGCSWPDLEDIRACPACACRLAAHERIELAFSR